MTKKKEKQVSEKKVKDATTADKQVSYENATATGSHLCVYGMRSKSYNISIGTVAPTLALESIKKKYGIDIKAKDKITFKPSSFCSIGAAAVVGEKKDAKKEDKDIHIPEILGYVPIDNIISAYRDDKEYYKGNFLLVMYNPTENDVSTKVGLVASCDLSNTCLKRNKTPIKAEYLVEFVEEGTVFLGVTDIGEEKASCFLVPLSSVSSYSSPTFKK